MIHRSKNKLRKFIQKMRQVVSCRQVNVTGEYNIKVTHINEHERCSFDINKAKRHCLF